MTLAPSETRTPPRGGVGESPITVVGIGEAAVCDDPRRKVITFSLGSCLGVVLCDRHARRLGMIHCLLPVDVDVDGRMRNNPNLFVSSGLPSLIQSMFEAGSARSDLVAYLAGASTVLHDEGGYFRIGERNLAVARKILQKNAIVVLGESVGGTHARTMYGDVASGEVCVRIGREETKL